MDHKSRNKRSIALEWWKELTSEQQKEYIYHSNGIITGGHFRDPNTLTGREIETLHYYVNGKKEHHSIPKRQVQNR